MATVSLGVGGVNAGAEVSRGAVAGRQPVAVTAPPPEHRADPSLKTYVFRSKPAEVLGYGTRMRVDRVTPPPVPGSIVGMDARVVDAQGNVVAQNVVMLHHLVFTNGGVDGSRRDGACPQRARSNERFYGTSEELRALTLPRGYGYPTTPADRWKMIWMVMNHRSEPRTVTIEYRVTVDPRPLAPVRPYWVSVVPCMPDPQYTVPGGSPTSARRSMPFRVPMSGRIVAIGGHLHGGGQELVLSQPRCGGRVLASSWPTYAPADDPLYQVTPLLHEPDPKNMSWSQTPTGWAVTRGERLDVSALYEGARPHMRVMGITHVYLAPDAGVPAQCAAPPADVELLGPEFPGGRPAPPDVSLTLASVGSDGVAREMSRPRGRVRAKRAGATIAVDQQSFLPANVSIPAGAAVRWVFKQRMTHDVTLVSGPRGFASPYSRRGDSWRHRFTVPGAYRIYCSLHPAYMSIYIRVRARPAAPAR